MIFFWRIPNLVSAANTRLNGVMIFLYFLYLPLKTNEIVYYFPKKIPVQPCRGFWTNRGGVCENLPYLELNTRDDPTRWWI